MQAASTALALVTGATAGGRGGAGVAEPSLRARRTSNLPPDLISALDSFNDSTVQPGQNSVTGGRQLTAEDLQARGLQLFWPGNVALPGQNAVPLAFLVLDVTHTSHRPSRVSQEADEGPPTASAAQTGRAASSNTARHRLVPVFTNSACRSLFKITEHADYVAVIKKLLKRDPLLSFALQKAVRHLKTGDTKPVNHVTPDPSGQTSSLCGLRLTPCVWRQDGHALPALMVEHNLPYDTEVVMPRLMRDYAVLSHVPAILTMIDFQGRVLYQNASSLEYLGDLLSVKHDSTQAGLLQVLYMYDLGSLEEMLDHVLLGQEWQGVVQVPYSMRRHLGHHQDSNTIIDFLRALGPPDGGSGSKDRGSLDLEDLAEGHAHTGESMDRIKKQHQKAASAFIMKHSGGAGRAVEAPRASGGADDTPSAGPGRSHSATSPTHNDEAPLPGVPGALQQRRFMSLIDTKQQPPAQQQQHSFLAQQGAVLGYEDDDGALIAEESDPSGSDEAEPECYHEVHAIPLLDPVLDKQVIMLVQTDVTPRVELENKLADLTDAQLSMLEQLFPRHIIEYMLARVPSKVSRNLRDLANTHEKVMVLFCDVVGFTSMSKEVEASQVMHFLNELYEAFDNLVDDYGMYKLDIVGDCYIVVAGLIKEDQDGFVCVDELDDDQVAVNAVRIMQFAKAMLRESRPVVMPHNNEPVSLRIGIHTGPLVSGLVGSKMPKFTLFGDTMNTASRMESTCRPGCIHVSDAFSRLLPHEEWESTGGVEVKGKGLMSTYLWSSTNQRKDALDQHAELSLRSLRKSGTMQGSFTSHKTRQSSRRESDAGALAGLTSNNPLMTILHNIRGGAEEDGLSEAGTYPGGGGGGGGAMGSGGALRPKSGRVRLPANAKSHMSVRLHRDNSMAGGSDRDDARRGNVNGAGSEAGGRRYKRTSESQSVRASPSLGTYYDRGGGACSEGRGRTSVEGGMSPHGGGGSQSGTTRSLGAHCTGGQRTSRKSDSGLARIRDRSRSRDLSRDGGGGGDHDDSGLDDAPGLRLGLRELLAARRGSRQSSSGAGTSRVPRSRASSRSNIVLVPGLTSTSGSGRVGGGYGGPGGASSGGGACEDDLDIDDTVLHLAPITSPTSAASTPGRRIG